ncbi:MAG: hypothetical protein V4526_02500 [Patescibacteria group bacterium]
MSKASRISLLVLFALLFLITGFLAVLSFIFSGFGDSYVQQLPPFVLLIAFIFYINLIRSYKKPIPLTKPQEIRSFLFIFILMIISTLPVIAHQPVWCAEALVRGIELLPGKCWYN